MFHYPSLAGKCPPGSEIPTGKHGMVIPSECEPIDDRMLFTPHDWLTTDFSISEGFPVVRVYFIYMITLHFINLNKLFLRFGVTCPSRRVASSAQQVALSGLSALAWREATTTRKLRRCLRRRLFGQYFNAGHYFHLIYNVHMFLRVLEV